MSQIAHSGHSRKKGYNPLPFPTKDVKRNLEIEIFHKTRNNYVNDYG